MKSLVRSLPQRTDDDGKTQGTVEYRPAKKTPSVTDSIKAKVETEAEALIDEVLKPKYVLPPRTDETSNYITDIRAKWYRNYFYFFSVYTCPGPNALSPTFEARRSIQAPSSPTA